MSPADLLPAVRALSRDDQLELLQVLATETGTDPTAAAAALFESHFPPGTEFRIETPLDCYEAAYALQQLLDAENAKGAVG